jgi:hypothetical protein
MQHTRLANYYYSSMWWVRSGVWAEAWLTRSARCPPPPNLAPPLQPTHAPPAAAPLTALSDGLWCESRLLPANATTINPPSAFAACPQWVHMDWPRAWRVLGPPDGCGTQPNYGKAGGGRGCGTQPNYGYLTQPNYGTYGGGCRIPVRVPAGPLALAEPLLAEYGFT